MNPPQFKISVSTFYVADQSDETVNRYVFAYTINIDNQGPGSAQLLRRYWCITDANGKQSEVRGDGVVGEQPTLTEGERYTYTSGSVLETPVGTMQGYYEMSTPEGQIFQVEIPLFRLAVPKILH